jgi:hypothetical protein
MSPDLWFEARSVEGARLWMPPPAAMETVMEVFNDDRIAHPTKTHIFVVPRLMTQLWRRKLGKDADVLFTVAVAAGNHFWERSQHESLIIAIVLLTNTLFTHTGAHGWSEKQICSMLSQQNLRRVSNMRNKVEQENFLSWQGACVHCGKIRRAGVGLFCSNFLLQRGTFPPCACVNVWCGECYEEDVQDPFPRLQGLEEREEESDVLLQDEVEKNRYRRGRNGDRLMTTFECDLCHFRNLNKRDPDYTSGKDRLTMTAIRRANLDAFWARESSTVKGNLDRVIADYRDTTHCST